MVKYRGALWKGGMGMPEGCIVCLGFFDGLHRGHQVLLKRGKAAAERLNLPLCAHTFDRSPSPFKQEITTLPEREQLLKAYGADLVYVSHFDEALRSMAGDVFFREVLVERLHARYVICGEDHRFGHLGRWDANALEKMCREKGLGFEKVPAFCLEGEKVSSSAIRQAIAEKNWEKAEEYLGRKVPEHWKQVNVC